MHSPCHRHVNCYLLSRGVLGNENVNCEASFLQLPVTPELSLQCFFLALHHLLLLFAFSLLSLQLFVSHDYCSGLTQQMVRIAEENFLRPITLSPPHFISLHAALRLDCSVSTFDPAYMSPLCPTQTGSLPAPSIWSHSYR